MLEVNIAKESASNCNTVIRVLAFRSSS